MAKNRNEPTRAVLSGIEQAFRFPPEFNYRDVANDAVGQARADRLYFLRLLDEVEARGNRGEFANFRAALAWMRKELE